MKGGRDPYPSSKPHKIPTDFSSVAATPVKERLNNEPKPLGAGMIPANEMHVPTPRL